MSQGTSAPGAGAQPWGGLSFLGVKAIAATVVTASWSKDLEHSTTSPVGAQPLGRPGWFLPGTAGRTQLLQEIQLSLA